MVHNLLLKFMIKNRLVIIEIKIRFNYDQNNDKFFNESQKNYIIKKITHIRIGIAK